MSGQLRTLAEYLQASKRFDDRPTYPEVLGLATPIDRKPFPEGERSGPVKDWTEMALITKEINKQKRHIPIRQLFQQAPRALLALKPPECAHTDLSGRQLDVN
jgi:hypothetical protein